MKFIDAHHHIWIPESAEPALGYHWLRDIGKPKPFGDPTPIQRNYEFDEFLKESTRHELVGSVYVQVDGAIDDPLAETAWVDSVFESTGLAHGIVALVDLSSHDAVRQLEAQAAYPRVKGIRQILARLDDAPQLCFASQHWLHNARWRSNFAALAELELSFDLQLYPEQMQEAADFLALHPRVPVIIDHAGSAYDRGEAGLERWTQGMRRLAELPHVSVKLSGFGMYDRCWTGDSIAWQVAQLLHGFGPERLLFGSNFPVDKLMQTYDAVISSVHDSVSLGMRHDLDTRRAGDRRSTVQHADADRVVKRIFEENAKRIYRLEPDVSINPDP